MRHVFVAMSLGVAIFLVVRAASKDAGVILRNREFAARLLAGTDLYAGDFHATYPPSWAVGMIPLACVPVGVARVGWALLQLLAIVIAGWLLLRLAAHAGLPTQAHLPLYVLALFGISRFFVRDMAGGGPAFLLFALVLGGWWQFVRGRDVSAGVLIGLAAGLKVTPGLFVVYFLWKRQWRVAAAALATVAVLFVLPVLFLGWGTYVGCVRYWLTSVSSFLSAGDLHEDGGLVPFTWMNQSLRCAVYRVLVSSDFEHPWFIDGLGLTPAVANWVVRGVTLAAVLWLGWLTRRVVPRESPRLLVELSIVACFSVLLSPVAWRTYFVVLLPALYLILHELHHVRPRRRGLLVGLLVYLGLTVGMSQELWGRELKNVIQAYYTVTWATLLVVFLLLRTGAARSPVGSATRRD